MPELKDPIIGIDLGTTNSLAAFVRDGHADILCSREGKRLVPSVVSFAGECPVVGYAAKNKKVRDAQHTVFSVKRLLGRGFEDFESAGPLPYKVVPGESGLNVEVGGKIYSPIEISAMILRELKKSAEHALGTEVTRAVITVPAYFNDSQRQATRAAGRIAGLNVLRIINEPTAASLAYGLDRKKEGLIAVYDLGGGTFDLSILKLHDGIFEVLATQGDTSLGGDDLDQAIARVTADEIQKQMGIDVRADLNAWAAVLEASEQVKIDLSRKRLTEIEVLIRGKTYRREWSRDEFEEWARPILERTREPCVQALKDAGIQASDLSDVVMVGGPTRLSIVQEVAQEIFGKKPNTSVHPDEVVAIGAAIQADILAGNNKDFLLLDVVPLSLGIETYGGLMETLISRNTRIPAIAKQVFTTFVDRQTAVDIHVLQGERERVSENRSLARFKLRGIQPMPAGLPRVEVSFLIDADGILQVAAKDLKTGNEQSIEVRPSYGLSEEEVQRILSAGDANQEADHRFKALVEARNDAEPILRASQKRLEDAFRLLPEDRASAVKRAIEELEEAVRGEDRDRIRQASMGLDRVTRELAEKIVAELKT